MKPFIDFSPFYNYCTNGSWTMFIEPVKPFNY